MEAMLKAVENHPNICLLSIEVGTCMYKSCMHYNKLPLGVADVHNNNYNTVELQWLEH